MNCIRISFLSLLFFNLCATEPSEEQNNEDPLKHLDPGIAVLKAESTKVFPDEFCSFILESVPQEVRDKVALLKDPYCPRWLIPKKILLYGPSGSGKTTLAQVIAQEINRPFIYISAGLLGNEYKNSVAQNLRRAIEPYKDTLCVVIIDEIDCILKKATNEKDLDLQTPKQVWEIIDLCANLPNVLVIGITNDVRGMDEPLQTRFAGDTVEVPLLNSLEMRKKAILFHLQLFTYDVSDSYINSLAKKTKKFSHRELEKLVIAAMTSAYLNKVLVPIVHKEDFETAYKQMEKSRSLLNKINWADYEKHLNYGLQIAGLVVNIASLITNWRMSWLNYLTSQSNHRESMNKQDDHQQQNRAQADKHFNQNKLQTQTNADRAYEQGERSQAMGQDHFEKNQQLTKDIAYKNERQAIEGRLLQKITSVLWYYRNKEGGLEYYKDFNAKPIGGSGVFKEYPLTTDSHGAREFNWECFQTLRDYGSIGLDAMVDKELKKQNKVCA